MRVPVCLSVSTYLSVVPALSGNESVREREEFLFFLFQRSFSTARLIQKKNKKELSLSATAKRSVYSPSFLCERRKQEPTNVTGISMNTQERLEDALRDASAVRVGVQRSGERKAKTERRSIKQSMDGSASHSCILSQTFQAMKKKRSESTSDKEHRFS